MEQAAGDERGAILTALGGRAVRGELLSRHTTARVGGPADVLVEAHSADELRELAQLARQHEWPGLILGAGSNVLVSDAGVRGLVILNKARRIKFQISKTKAQSQTAGESFEAPKVWAESGVILPALARECNERGLAGLEWAIGVPGTVGGAVVGNAGAHGCDVAHALISATVLEPDGSVCSWTAQECEFGYRTSRFKSASRQISNRQSAIGNPVVLAAEFKLTLDTREACEARAAEFTERRKRTQPPGASLGSMFKNPPGDYAGRLIEAAGLKGARVGQVEISNAHANFFVNLGGATAADICALVRLARGQVAERLGVHLETEIEVLGDW